MEQKRAGGLNIAKVQDMNCSLLGKVWRRFLGRRMCYGGMEFGRCKGGERCPRRMSLVFGGERGVRNGEGCPGE